MSNDDDLMSIREVADLLGISRATLNRYRADGIAAPEIHLGSKTVRFRRSDVLAWLEESAAA